MKIKEGTTGLISYKADKYGKFITRPFLWDSKIGLGACGDWCTGPRIELAFESGNALANEIIMDLR